MWLYYVLFIVAAAKAGNTTPLTRILKYGIDSLFFIPLSVLPCVTARGNVKPGNCKYKDKRDEVKYLSMSQVHKAKNCPCSWRIYNAGRFFCLL